MERETMAPTVTESVLPTSDTSKETDWTTPRAMAIPKEGYFTLEQGRWGPIYPRTPACYGFSVIAKVKPGREEAIRAYGKSIEEAVKGDPTVLAPLKLHYLRWILFDVGSGLHFMYQGIFDTDFDKYLEDAVALFVKTGITTVFVNLEGWPEDWKTNLPAVHQVLSRSPVPELSRVRRVSFRDGRRDQEGAQAEERVLRDARRNAVMRPTMLEFDDIQHFLLTRTAALAARYEFLSFRGAEGGRAWLNGIVDKVGTAQAVGAGPLDSRWVTVAFTWSGLRALGVDDALLETFPAEFKQGMPARANILGTTGANHPDHWVGGLASPELHAIAVLFARDVAERERCKREHDNYISRIPGVRVLSGLDLEATPPLDYAHDHFGYRDRLSQPVVEGTGAEPTPGSGPPIKAGEFFLGYEDESGFTTPLPQPDVLSRNGSYLAYLRLRNTSARSATSCASMERHATIRNSSRRR